MKGALLCEINGQAFDLEECDSLLFLASRPHRYCNQTAATAQILVGFQSLSGEMMAHQHHLG